MVSHSHPIGGNRTQSSMSTLGCWLVAVFFLQSVSVQAQQCTTFPCSMSVAMYGPAPGAIWTPPDSPVPIPSTPSTSTPSTSSSTKSSIKSSSTSSTPLSITSPSTLSRSSSSTPSNISLNEPSNAPDSAPPNIPSNTPPKVPDSRKPSSSSPKFILPNGPSSGPTGSGTGITTRVPLPTFHPSSGVAMLSTTAAVSANGTSSNNATSTACGQCSVMAEHVKVFYWPTASVKSDCARASSAISLQPSPTYAANATTNATQTLNALGGDRSIDVIDGFTYTYPSTYVSVVGEIAVSNSCGMLGKAYTNPTPVAVEAITTASYATWPSVCRPQGNYANVVIDTLKVEDIACPTWGLSDPFSTTCDGSVYLTATEGPPYNPVILVPTQFLNYDPAWGKCLDVPINGPFLLPCGVYDPPRALHTATAMVPDPTPAADPPAATPPPALPEVAASPNMAQHTAPPQVHGPQTVKAPVPRPVQPDKDPKSDPNQDPGQGKSSPDGALSSDQNQGPASNNVGPAPNNQPADRPDQGPPNTNNNPQSGQPQDPGQNQGNSNNAPAADPNQHPGSDSGGQGGNNQPAGGQAPPVGHPEKAAPAPQPIPQITINIGGSQPSPALGEIINGAFGDGPPAPAGQQNNGGSGQGGSNSGSNLGGTPGSNSGVGLGGDLSGSSGGGQGGGSGGNSGGSSGSSPGGGSETNSGGNSEGNPGGTQGGVAGSNADGNPGGSSGGNPSEDTQGASTGSQVGNSGASSQSGGQIENAQPNAPAFTPHAITAFGQTLNAINPSAIAVAGKTLSAGGPAFTANGNFFSVGPSGNLVAGTLAPGATSAPVLTFGGSAYTANANSQFVVGGQTLAPGGQITVSGTPISLPPGSSNLAVVGSSTQSLSIITPAPGQGHAILSFGGSTYSANAASQFIIAGQTLNPGAEITVSGTPISLAATGAASNIAVIGTSTQALGNAAAAQSPALLTFDGSTYTANSASQFLIGGKTLTPGGQITVFGMPISEGSDGSFAVIGGSTQSLATPGPTQAPALLTFNGQTYTANSASEFVINGQTLTPGGQITVSGTPISEAASESGLMVVGSSTQVLGHATPGVTNAAVMTFGGRTFTADAAGGFTIDGQTLTPGGVITISGTPISEGLGATDVVIGTSTEVLSTAAAVTSSAMTFEGAGASVRIPTPVWLLGWLGIIFLSGALFLL